MFVAILFVLALDPPLSAADFSVVGSTQQKPAPVPVIPVPVQVYEQQPVPYYYPQPVQNYWYQYQQCPPASPG